VYDDLISKVDQLAVAGGAAKDDQALALENAKLAKLLSDDKIEIHRTRPDGSIVAQERQLGDTMQDFKRIFEQKRSELEGHIRELHDVEASITITRRDVEDTEKNAVKTLTSELDVQISGLFKEIDKLRSTALSDVKKAKREERDAYAEQKKALDAYVRAVA